MNTATLVREHTGRQGTFGTLTLPDGYQCQVAEPPWLDNRRNISCIPTGTYTIRPHHSPRFGQCLLVEDVPNRSHILVHAGNVAGDRTLGLHSHTHGCLLPGTRRGTLHIKGRDQIAVMASRTALRHILRRIKARTALEVTYV